MNLAHKLSDRVLSHWADLSHLLPEKFEEANTILVLEAAAKSGS